VHAPTVSYEVDGFGRSADIDNFGAVFGVDELADFFSAALVKFCGFLA